MNNLEIKKHQIWMHKKKKTFYRIVHKGNMKANGNWWTSVTYIPIVNPTNLGGEPYYYTRDSGNFLENFIKIEDE